MPKQAHLFWWLLVAQALCFCSPKINPATITPDYAASVDLTPTRSEVVVPVEIPWSDLNKQVNEQVTGTVFQLKNLSATGADNFNLTVKKADKIQISGSGEQLQIEVPLAVSLAGSVKIGVGNFALEKSLFTDFSIRIVLNSTVGLNSQWEIETNTQLKNYGWIVKPSIQIAGFSLPLTFVADILVANTRNLLTQVLDNQIRKQIDVKASVQKAWNSLQAPILVDASQQLWLVIKPVSISLSSITCYTSHLKVVVGVQALAEATLASQPPGAIEQTPLPALQKMASQNSETFDIYLKASTSLEQAQSQARSTLIGQTFASGKKQVRVTSFDLFGNQGFAICRVGIEGSIRGTIYLKGTPQIEPASQAMYLADLDFELDTKNILAKTAAWLFDNKIEKKLADKLRFPLDAPLANIQVDLNRTLENYALGDWGALKVAVETLEVTRIAITPVSIAALLAAKGKAKLVLKGFK